MFEPCKMSNENASKIFAWFKDRKYYVNIFMVSTSLQESNYLTKKYKENKICSKWLSNLINDFSECVYV